MNGGKMKNSHLFADILLYALYFTVGLYWGACHQPCQPKQKEIFFSYTFQALLKISVQNPSCSPITAALIFHCCLRITSLTKNAYAHIIYP